MAGPVLDAARQHPGLYDVLDRFEDVRAGKRIVSSTSYALPAVLRELGAEVRMLPTRSTAGLFQAFGRKT